MPTYTPAPLSMPTYTPYPGGANNEVLLSSRSEALRPDAGHDILLQKEPYREQEPHRREVVAVPDVAFTIARDEEEYEHAPRSFCHRLEPSAEHRGAPAGRAAGAGGLRVTILSATGLRRADWLPGRTSDPYCVCEISGRPQSGFQTQAIKNSLQPVWNEEGFIPGYVSGEALEFTVFDEDLGKKDDLLGKAVLSGALCAGGFEGELPLAQDGGGGSASLRLRVQPSDGRAEPASSERPLFAGYWDSDRSGVGGMRNDYSGDVGFAFVAKTPAVVMALGRQVGRGLSAPRAPARVTLWATDSQAALASVSVGPECPAEGGYAYGSLGAGVALEAGREYRISQQCSGGMPDAWFDGTVERKDLEAISAIDFLDFRGSVFCDGYGFPARYDDDGRFATRYRRAGMLNMKLAVDAPLPSLRGTGRLAGPSAKAARPDRLAIRLVCMSPPP